MYWECTINYHIRGSNKLVVWNFDGCIYFSPMFRHTQPRMREAKRQQLKTCALGRARPRERFLKKVPTREKVLGIINYQCRGTRCWKECDQAKGESLCPITRAITNAFLRLAGSKGDLMIGRLQRWQLEVRKGCACPENTKRVWH